MATGGESRGGSLDLLRGREGKVICFRELATALGSQSTVHPTK